MVWMKLGRAELKIVVLTFLSIVATHSAREGWWMVKSEVHFDLNFDSTFLGTLDFTFLVMYSLGYYASGVIANRFGLVKVLAWSMLLATVSLWLVAVCGMLGITDKWVYLVLWGMEGPSQGTILTAAVTILGNWVDPGIRGQVMGIWGANSSVGNIYGQWVAAFTRQDLELEWEAVVVATSASLVLVAAMIYMSVEAAPPVSSLEQKLLENSEPETQTGFFETWSIKGVPECAFCYGCIKMLNYAFFMWLPFYLRVQYQMDIMHISILATLYDLGGVLGSIVLGYVSDKFVKKTPSVVLAMGSAVPFFLLFQVVTEETAWIFFGLVPTVGMLVGGSANMISVAVAADLAQYSSSKPKPTVIGIVNGTGALGAACGQVLIGYLQTYSWSLVFYYMMLVSSVSVLVLLPEAYRVHRSVNCN